MLCWLSWRPSLRLAPSSTTRKRDAFPSLPLTFAPFELSQGDVELPEVPSDELPEAPEKKAGLLLRVLGSWGAEGRFT